MVYGWRIGKSEETGLEYHGPNGLLSYWAFVLCHHASCGGVI